MAVADGLVSVTVNVTVSPGLTDRCRFSDRWVHQSQVEITTHAVPANYHSV